MAQTEPCSGLLVTVDCLCVLYARTVLLCPASQSAAAVSAP